MAPCDRTAEACPAESGDRVEMVSCSLQLHATNMTVF